MRVDTWERVVRAVDAVRTRLHRATASLKSAGIAHAIVDGNAVAAWVAQVDEEAVRTTKDVDIIVRRDDFERVKQTLESVGFVHRHAAGIAMFLDGTDGSPRSAVHVIFAGEFVRAGDTTPVPDPAESNLVDGLPVLSLQALVRNKLEAFRDKDRTHLRDFIDLDMIDRSWAARLPPALAARLEQLLDNPE